MSNNEALTIENLLQLKEESDLKEFSKKVFAKWQRTLQELNETKSKLEHLENLAKNSSVLSVGSNEENLCMIEINRLYQKAQREPLEFNEVKAFEIYVKSLMLIRGKTVETEKKKKKTEELTDEQLLSLATKMIKVEDDSGTEQ
jgi:hypothetical protein